MAKQILRSTDVDPDEKLSKNRLEEALNVGSISPGHPCFALLYSLPLLSFVRYSSVVQLTATGADRRLPAIPHSQQNSDA